MGSTSKSFTVAVIQPLAERVVDRELSRRFDVGVDRCGFTLNLSIGRPLPSDIGFVRTYNRKTHEECGENAIGQGDSVQV